MSDELGAIIDRIADQLRDAVAEIEASVPATRGHYGDYMALLGMLAKDKRTAEILAAALKKAGANEQGVDDALRVSF
jgi:RNA binding exosome subunit